MNAEPKYWSNQLNKIFYNVRPSGLGAKYKDIINLIMVIKDNWVKIIPEILDILEDYDLNIDDFFKLERIVSYNVASFLKSFELIYNKKNRNPLNINGFIEKVSHSFLPKNVFYLEEFGLPRFISKKIHNSKLINLEDNDLEINEIIEIFLKIGLEELMDEIHDLDTFDEYVLKVFYNGLRI